MNDKGATDEGQLRMQFELSRDDDPSLYDDLVRFKKGTKRINRLRFLAHEGTVAQAALQGAAAACNGALPTPVVAAGRGGRNGLETYIPVTAEMFDAGSPEE